MMKERSNNKILLIDSCVRDCSRTRALAEYLIGKLDGTVERVLLEAYDFPHMDQDFLRMRDDAVAADDHSGDVFAIARQFAAADTIVIAAPFWDLSFPASLKTYIEQINVLNVTFGYTKEGTPFGLCSAKKLYYVTTAGGPIYSAEYGYGYIKSQCDIFYGIPETVLIKAENLDLIGADTEKILDEARKNIDGLFA